MRTASRSIKRAGQLAACVEAHLAVQSLQQTLTANARELLCAVFHQPAAAWTAATGNTAGARMTATSAIEGTCYEPKLSGAVDLEVRVIAPLDGRPRGLPTFPSPLGLFAAKEILGIWGALDENSRR